MDSSACTDGLFRHYFQHLASPSCFVSPKSRSGLTFVQGYLSVDGIRAVRKPDFLAFDRDGRQILTDLSRPKEC